MFLALLLGFPSNSAARLLENNGVGSSGASDSDDNGNGLSCIYELAGDTGTAKAFIKSDSLKVKFTNAKPNTVYTVWVDFKSRATGQLSSDYPLDASGNTEFSGPGIGRGVAPAFAKVAPVYEGMRLDLNAVKTNAAGNAVLNVDLDYDLLGSGTCPVTAETLTLQGEFNRVGGSWLRQYVDPVEDNASAQVLDANGQPELVLATAQGLTIVGHFIPLSHGHTPGVGGVDHFPGFKGDFPTTCG